MIRDEDAPVLLSQLEALAEKLGIGVRYERFDEEELSLKGAACRLRGRRLILIDARLPLREKCRVLVRELRKNDLSTVYVSPLLRLLLEQ